MASDGISILADAAVREIPMLKITEKKCQLTAHVRDGPSSDFANHDVTNYKLSSTETIREDLGKYISGIHIFG